MSITQSRTSQTVFQKLLINKIFDEKFRDDY